MSQPRIAVIGAGAWGRNHVRVFHQLGALAAVVDGRDEVRAQLAKDYPGVALAPDFDALDSSAIEGVVVATPASTHASVAIKALQRGLHVLVEKPCATNLADVEAVIEASRSAGKVMMVGHLLLYHNHIRKLRELIQGGAIGKPLYAYGARLNLGKVRVDENVISSLAPHDLSVMHYLIGKRVLSARAEGLAVIDRPQRLIDVAFVTARFEGGVSAHFHLSWLDPFKRREMIIVGDEAMLVFDDMLPDADKLRLYRKRVDPPEAQSYGEFLQAINVRDEGFEAVPVEASEPLRNEAEDFLRCISSGGTPVSGIESALEVARAMAMLEG